MGQRKKIRFLKMDELMGFYGYLKCIHGVKFSNLIALLEIGKTFFNCLDGRVSLG